VLLTADWDVRFWAWPSAGPGNPPADWAGVVAGEPFARMTADRLAIRPGGGAPAEGVPANHFATVATTTLELPAGTWRFRVLSDDGVRVLVDGRTVIENWTWHAPTVDTAEVRLEAGRHDVRVEHFEIDGHAVLELELELELEVE